MVKFTTRQDFPSHILAALNAYLHSLPSFSEKGINPVSLEHHGYLTMQILKIISLLENRYGYIFNQTNCDIKALDMVHDNSIYICSLPIIEKSAEEFKMLYRLQLEILSHSLNYYEAKDIPIMWINHSGLHVIEEKILMMEKRFINSHAKINMCFIEPDLNNLKNSELLKNISHQFYFKGTYPKFLGLTEDNLRSTQKLKYAHCVYKNDIEILVDSN